MLLRQRYAKDLSLRLSALNKMGGEHGGATRHFEKAKIYVKSLKGGVANKQ
jgi:hypothetical protein